MPVVAAIAVLLCSLVIGTASAQGSGVRLPARWANDPLVLQVDSLYAQGKHRESLELLKDHLGRAPSDYPAWVLAARAALVLGFADQNSDSASAWFNRAITYGEGAQAIDSLGEDGRYATLAARGRLALIGSPFEKARLGREVEHEALALLAIDSLNAGAQNALGKVYFAIARLSSIQRFIARPWLGNDLTGRATWKAAGYHLRRAVELQPQWNFYHLDLGELLLDRGRRDAARYELRTAVSLPLETPQQVGFRKQAQALLDQMDRHKDHGPLLSRIP